MFPFVTLRPKKKKENAMIDIWRVSMIQFSPIRIICQANINKSSNIYINLNIMLYFIFYIYIFNKT